MRVTLLIIVNLRYCCMDVVVVVVVFIYVRWDGTGY